MPPPGFNAEEAKKPLPKEEEQKREASSKDQPADVHGALKEEIAIPRNEPTSNPKTKAMEAHSLSELAANKAAADKKIAEKEKKEGKKLTLWQKVKHEVSHYWDGTKLLATEVKISSRLALKMAAGYELTRRDNRQVCSIDGTGS